MVWFNSKNEHWELSNFAYSPFELDGRKWTSVEHYYQAQKAIAPAEADAVRDAPSPMAARQLGRRVAIRPDWDAVKDDVMARALRAKFTQHAPSRQKLLATGDDELHEDAAYDPHWGGQGRDRLGQLLTGLRGELRAAGGS